MGGQRGVRKGQGCSPRFVRLWVTQVKEALRPQFRAAGCRDSRGTLPGGQGQSGAFVGRQRVRRNLRQDTHRQDHHFVRVSVRLDQDDQAHD